MAEYVHKINGKQIAASNVVPGTPLASALEAISAGAFRIVPLTDGESPVPNPEGAIPPAPRSTKIIYLTKDEQSTAEDPYTEWIYQPGSDPVWVVIGTTSVDLDDLHADVTSTNGTNVQVQVIETAGKITAVSIAADNTENNENKVRSWQQTPDDTHYPSEKLVKDELDTKADKVTFEPGHNPDGNIPELDENGNLDDSGVAAADVVTNVLISGESSLVVDHVATIPKADDYSATIPAQGDTPEQPGTPSSWGVVQVSTIEL